MRHKYTINLKLFKLELGLRYVISHSMSGAPNQCTGDRAKRLDLYIQLEAVRFQTPSYAIAVFQYVKFLMKQPLLK